MERVWALFVLIAIIVICGTSIRKYPKYSVWITIVGVIAAAVLYGALSNL